MRDLVAYEIEFTDPAMASWALLRQTWAAASKTAETKLAKVGLTPEKAALLWACRSYPGLLTPAELGRLLFSESQTVIGLLNRMERDGLVRRIPKRKGRPFTEIRLTPKGSVLSEVGADTYQKLIVELMGDLPEREQFHGTLRALRQRMLDQMYVSLETVSCSSEANTREG